MIRDLSREALEQTLDADICIVGAGPAGISIALELMKTGRSVVLLESGGRGYEPSTQKLYAGDITGRQYYSLDGDRIRMLGGTTFHWGGWCAPLTPIDMVKRSWVPDSGWPLDWDDLEGHYARAHELCEIGEYGYDPSEWLGSSHPLLPMNDDLLTHFLYQFSGTNFGQAYAERLSRSQSTTVVLHANAIDIDCTESLSHVRRIRAKSLDGKEITVRALAFVIAAGGLENPRLLLAARKQNRSGLGNDNDLVGRYFADHLEGVVGHVVVGSRDQGRWLASYEKRLTEKPKMKAMAAVRVSAQTLQKRRMLNVALTLNAQQDTSAGYLAAKRLARALAGERWQASAGLRDGAQDAANVLTDLDEVALWLHHRLRGTHYEFPVTSEPAQIIARMEQAPNPDSRVSLTEETDELGLPRIALDWRVGEPEKATLLESAKIIAAEIGRTTGLRVKLEEWLFSEDAEIPTSMFPGHHHIGTTRMGSTPKTGVVDKDCRVFGLGNLYMAGSSVFPTSGYANPTLNIVALAVRLAHHLDHTLSSDGFIGSV